VIKEKKLINVAELIDEKLNVYPLMQSL